MSLPNDVPRSEYYKLQDKVEKLTIQLARMKAERDEARRGLCAGGRVVFGVYHTDRHIAVEMYGQPWADEHFPETQKDGET